MKIYFAGPLFCEAELKFNLALTEKLETEGFEVFLPQRDGVEADKPPYDQIAREERRKAMFALGKQKVYESEIFLFVLDGRVPDEGACVELGLAHAHKEFQAKKYLIGLETDIRAAFIQARINVMLDEALDDVVRTESDLLSLLKQYRTKNKI